MAVGIYNLMLLPRRRGRRTAISSAIVVRPLVAAKLIGEIGDLSRLRGADRFAALAGVAPIPASSGQTRWMRLNRGGNRQLNRALFTIAMVQPRHYPPAQAFIAGERTEGKSGREDIRCLKRHLAPRRLSRTAPRRHRDHHRGLTR